MLTQTARFRYTKVATAGLTAGRHAGGVRSTARHFFSIGVIIDGAGYPSILEDTASLACQCLDVDRLSAETLQDGAKSYALLCDLFLVLVYGLFDYYLIIHTQRAGRFLAEAIHRLSVFPQLAQE